MAVAGAASLLVSSAGSAAPAPRQSEALGCLPLGCPRPFRLIRLCEVLPPERGGRPEGLFNLYTSDNTFGISDDGFVTGTRRVLFPSSTGCDPEGFHSDLPGPGGTTVYETGHSFLWLPRAAFGLPQSAPEPAGCADTVYDLHGHAGLPANEFSFGNDISAIADDGTGNEIAYVVGISFCNPDLTRAVAWRLHTYTTTPSVSIFDITPSGTVAFAYAVSAPRQLDDTTATHEVVVAGRRAPQSCPGNHIATATWLDVTGMTSVFTLDPFVGVSRTTAVDVAMLETTPPSVEHRVVGNDVPPPSSTSDCGEFSLFAIGCGANGVDSHRWGYVAAGSGYGVQQPLNYPPPPPPQPFVELDGQERGVNENGWVAGWGRSPTAGAACFPHAVVKAPDVAAGVIQDITPDPDEPRRSRAEAIGALDDTGFATAVGWSSSFDRALVWRGYPGDPWCEYDATTITLNDVDCVAVNESVCLPNAKEGTPNGIRVEIVELHDVNRYGHAVGVIRETIFDEGGTDPVSITYYAAVLGPAADLNEDLRVGPEDLAIFLGEWGNPSPSIGDLDADGDVDQADLSLLIGSWQFVGGLSRVTVPGPTANGCDCGLLGGGSPEGGPEYASASTSADPDAILEAIAILGFGTMGEFAGWVASATDVQIDAAIAFIQQYATQEAGQ